MAELQQALKEWAVAVDALVKGQTVMLLRKGGIREPGFHLQHPQVLLYPTYEHQQPTLLKPAYASKAVVPEGKPDTVLIKAWAEITDHIQIQTTDQVASLLPWHIWTPQFVTDRLRWQPQQPLSVLLLRTYGLPEPVLLAWQPGYGGCRSWIQLAESIDIRASVPALPAAAYEAQVQQIQTLVGK
jgi:hypothetical protein